MGDALLHPLQRKPAAVGVILGSRDMRVAHGKGS